MALLSQMMRTAAITGRPDIVHAWVADRQGGRWAEQTVRAALPARRPAPAAAPAAGARHAELLELRRRGAVTDAEYEALRAGLPR